MGKWASVAEADNVNHLSQVVGPSKLRELVLTISHDGHAGHLWVRT